MTDWYKDRVLKALREDDGVRLEVARILSDLSRDEAALEGLDDIETLIFGERIECPHDCGSLNLPGAPACWGCEEEKS